MILWVRLAVLALLGLTVSIGSAHTTSTSSIARGLLVDDPTEDPFYQPPAGFESEAPGTILRNRRVVTAFLGLIPNPVETHQLLYRTTATNGSAIAAMTTIFKPTNPKTDRFVSWYTAYNSVSVKCSPSYQWQLGAPQTDLIAPMQMIDTVVVYLSQGYILAAPDYEGPEAAFGAGPLQGMVALDNMRAVSNYYDTLGLSSDKPMIVSAGYSAGGIPSGWAASLQPRYAPELNIKGWVAGGAPTNLRGTMVYLDDTAFSGFIPAIIAGLAKPSAYGAQLNPVIDRIFTPKGREKIEATESQCPLATVANFFGKSLFSVDIQKLGPAFFNETTIDDIMSQNILGAKESETPSAPVFIYHAAHDEVIPYANATTLVDSWCNNGASVSFTTYEHGGHVAVELISLPDILNFIEAAFAGDIENNSGCSRKSELKNALDPRALGGELEPLLVKLIQDLTNPGGNDENVSF